MDGSLFFFCGAVPIALAAGFSDLRTMRIPNWISVALLGVFVVTALIFLPLEETGWRLLAGLCMFVLTFTLNQAGQMGGGDAKLLAASTPYIATGDITLAMYILSISMLGTLAVHRLARAITPVRQMAPQWASWENKKMFPMGISIAAALIVYLFVKL